MDEQCSSSSNDFMSLFDEDEYTLSLFPGQQSNASSQMISREWMSPIQPESPMRLNECMNLVAKTIGIPNPMEGRISATNMTKKSLNDMLNDYANLFETNFVVIPLNENILIDFQHHLVFDGASGVVGAQSFYQRCVFILHDCKKQMFTLLYVRRTDNSRKVHFDEDGLKYIHNDLPDFIEKWNRQKTQSSASTMNNNRSDNDPITKGANSCEINNNATSFSSASTVDKGVFVSAREALTTSLEFVLQMVTLTDCQLDHIQLKQKSINALLNHFNRLNDTEKFKMIIGELTSIIEDFQAAVTLDREEEVGENSSLKVERGRYSRDLCPYLTLQGGQMLAIDQNAFNDMEVDDISRPPIESMADIFDSSSSAMGISTSGNKPIDGTIETNDAPTTPDLIELLAQESGILTDTAQSGGSTRVRAGDQISSHPQASSSTHLPNTTQASKTTSTPSSKKTILSAPKMKTPPKQGYKVRYPKDFILKDNDKIFVELLQGVGCQGTRIRVEVPPRERRKMYLAVNVRTIEDEEHPSKLVVPKGTRANAERVNHENHLDFLEFDKCDPTDSFDPNKRIVYLEITEKEHENGFKDVPVHMLNLYQTQRLTKDMIKNDHLRECRLAFWFCVKENGNYIPISDETLSNRIIEKESKRSKNPSKLATTTTDKK